MPQNFYEVVWIFIIYAFIGWCTEVSYAALNTGKFVNRGFLNGPYCPIYGCGVVIVVAVLTPLKENLLILFAGSLALTTVLEYITGLILEKAFHNKWWDYSDKPFNIKGYVCLKFSVYWGLACTFIMQVLHPIIYNAIVWIPQVAGVAILLVLMCIFLTDCSITVSTILKFNKRLRVMDDMASMIHKLSDEIGENIYENVTGVMEKSEEFQEKYPEFVDKITETAGNVKELPETAKNKLTEGTEAAKLKLAETAEAAKSKITGSTIATREKISDVFEEKRREYEASREAKKKEYAELTAKYEKLFEEKNFGFQRLIKAFPDMTSRENNETLEKFKLHFNIRKKDQKGNDTDN